MIELDKPVESLLDPNFRKHRDPDAVRALFGIGLEGIEVKKSALDLASAAGNALPAMLVMRVNPGDKVRAMRAPTRRELATSARMLTHPLHTRAHLRTRLCILSWRRRRPRLRCCLGTASRRTSSSGVRLCPAASRPPSRCARAAASRVVPVRELLSLAFRGPVRSFHSRVHRQTSSTYRATSGTFGRQRALSSLMPLARGPPGGGAGAGGASVGAGRGAKPIAVELGALVRHGPSPGANGATAGAPAEAGGAARSLSEWRELARWQDGVERAVVERPTGKGGGVVTELGGAHISSIRFHDFLLLRKLVTQSTVRAAPLVFSSSCAPLLWSASLGWVPPLRRLDSCSSD